MPADCSTCSAPPCLAAPRTLPRSSNRWFTSSGGDQSTLGLTWTVACSLSGTADIMVTSTTSSGAALQQARLSLPVQASCAASSCE